MKIYIAGPMTGRPNYNRKAFITAAVHIATKTNLIPISFKLTNPSYCSHCGRSLK